MTRARAVVFDLGKVLLEFDYHIAARALAENGNRSADDIFKVLLGTPLLLRYERGLLTSQEFYSQFCAVTGYARPLEHFEEAFGAIFSPINSMIQLHAEVRQAGYPTFIFSNTNELAIRHIRKTYPFFANFDGYILSYEHGWMKPDPKLYEVVEAQCQRRGAEVLYIDDRAENIDAARERGWQTILHESPSATRALVEQTLGLPQS